MTTSDGVRLEYTERGNPSGGPVVLVAGFKAAATSWAANAVALERAGCRVIAVDRRGHGLSEAVEHGATMARHGEDLHELLEALDVRDAILIGGSMGGNVIWAMIDRFGTDRVAAVVIVDQTPRMLGSDEWPHGFYDYDASNADSLFANGVPNPGRVSVWSKGPVRVLRVVRALRGGRRAERGGPAYRPDELALLGDHAKADWRRTIAKTDVPVLFVAGDESEFWPASHAPAAAALAPKGRAVVIRRAGHAANIEQPKRFNTAVLEFLAELAGRAA